MQRSLALRPVAFAHALCVVRSDVLIHDLFPSPSAQPATEETLYLQLDNKTQLIPSYYITVVMKKKL